MREQFKTHQQNSAYASPWSIGHRLKPGLWGLCWALFCCWTPKPLKRWRLLWLRLFGCTIHGRPFVLQRARIHAPWNLVLHDRACLGDRANAYSLGEIEIGPGATVAREAYLCTGTHQFDDPARPLQTAKITVGKERSLGPGLSLCRGFR